MPLLMNRLRFVAFLLTCAWLNTAVACRSTSNSPAVDRHNPEAVLRAYFAAWARNDTVAQASFMASDDARLAYEPVDSLRLLSVTLAEGATPTMRVYAVSFEVSFKGGRSLSMIT